MKIDSNTSVYAVMGDPVSHSLGPVMHNRAFAYTGYNGVYLAFQVTDITAAISGIKTLGFKGASITIPHKVAVMEHLDELDDNAKKIGAVNTIINRRKRLCGYNSDCLGAMQALKEKTDITGKKVAIIGSGGAARAIGFGILSEGGKVTIFSRSAKKGERLAIDLGSDYHPLSEFTKAGCEIFINATPVGMLPDTEAMPIPRKVIAKETVVMDIVYNPLKTRLLKEAQDIGCITVDGVAMFVYQGAFQFELWTGKKAPVTFMTKTVLDALGEK